MDSKKKSFYLIEQINYAKFNHFDRKVLERFLSIVFRIILFLFVIFILIVFDLFDWLRLFRKTICFRLLFGQQYFLVTFCYISIDISLLFITYSNFIRFYTKMFILIPYTLINWVFYPYRSYKYKKFSKIINDCDASLLETIKLIVIYAELISTIILAILSESI